MFRTVIAREFWVSGRFCLRILQGAGRPVSMLRHQDGGFSSRRRLAGTARPTGRSGESAASPRAATSAAPPVAEVVGRPPYTANRVSLHGDSVLLTRRIGSSYTEGLGSLHGGCVGDIGLSLNCCQCCQYPIPIPNWPLVTLELATIPHWQHSPTTGETRKKSIVVAGTILV